MHLEDSDFLEACSRLGCGRSKSYLEAQELEALQDLEAPNLEELDREAQGIRLRGTGLCGLEEN